MTNSIDKDRSSTRPKEAKWIVVIMVLLLIMPIVFSFGEGNAKASPVRYENQVETITQYVTKQMNKGNLPGLALIVVRDNQILINRGFGEADQKRSAKVTSDTLFEIGSNSKAFTAAGIYWLEKQGLLDTADSVSQYIPWFSDNYADITIKQLLHHTSGISPRTIGYIPASMRDDALEQTVRMLLEHELEFNPGERFNYATINYDVLALIMERVTGQSYEQFMRETVLAPLGLKDTHFGVEKPELNTMATGYKMRFFRPTAYDAPMYRGNTAAGYIIMSANDLGKWMQIQLGGDQASTDGMLLEAIRQSHLPNRQVPPDADGASYAGGWEVVQSGGGELHHGGSNPNYSSYILLRPESGLGIGVMANINSASTKGIALGIESILDDKPIAKISSDRMADLDQLLSIVILFLLLMMATSAGAIGQVIYQLYQGKRKFRHNGWKNVRLAVYVLLFLVGFAAVLYRMPHVFFEQMPWSAVKVWGPATIIPGILSIFGGGLVFCAYILLTRLFPAEGEKLYFQLTVVGIVTGLGNASIIFIINEKLNQSNENTSWDWFLYFVTAVVVYVIGSKLVQTHLIALTSNIVFDKRRRLIDKVLHASYERLEQLDRGQIHTALNNDTTAISELPRMLLQGVTSLVTVVFCFVYLGAKNVFGLLLAIGVIVLAAALYRSIGQQAHVFWNKNRDTQEAFFGFINDLVQGLKELNLHRSKREAFRQDMMESCEQNRETNVQGSLKMVNVFVVGELLFTFVLGAIVFGAPLLLADVTNELLQNYVLVILYMIGPVHGILNFIPNVMQLQVIWKRLTLFEGNLDSMHDEERTTIAAEEQAVAPDESEVPGPICIELKHVTYRYQDERGETFELGPINFTFRAGELVFITGGNGSGKSTLVKILTGLYVPAEGEVLVNGKRLSKDKLGESFSVIFSDYYLFDTLYGVETAAAEEKITRNMKLLQIDDKVTVAEGRFSTTKLSTGQKKRLAMLVSLLEDKPVSLFDEWAAEQDPEFREFFYQQLLMQLKSAGKCIIVVTHDDRFFPLADKTLKLERGQMVRELVSS